MSFIYWSELSPASHCWNSLWNHHQFKTVMVCVMMWSYIMLDCTAYHHYDHLFDNVMTWHIPRLLKLLGQQRCYIFLSSVWFTAGSLLLVFTCTLGDNQLHSYKIMCRRYLLIVFSWALRSIVSFTHFSLQFTILYISVSALTI